MDGKERGVGFRVPFSVFRFPFSAIRGKGLACGFVKKGSFSGFRVPFSVFREVKIYFKGLACGFVKVGRRSALLQ